MATHWTIDHVCGHQADKDLSHKAADERAGFARWLATRDCTACWQAARTTDTDDTATWIAGRRAAEQEAADTWAHQFDMQPLTGTDKAVQWATRCRHQLVTAAHTSLVIEGDLDEQAWQDIEQAARTIGRAGWWIDQRDADPTDLPELVAAATTADRPHENPF
ncbi:hypothetical protein [Streptomyces sp. SID3343]|uniref:hypothetical protein n=1 Tax=Streptomyces sp. SID3343 TaxID=2690260 RepID=UPI0031F7C1BE